MRFLKQSTSVDLPVGPFLDATDGVTAETTLTITQADIRLKKNGGAWAQKNAAQTLSHEENGNYELTLDATDTDTLGLLRLHIAESGALPVWEDFMVMPANVWDSLFGADVLQVDVAQWLGTAAATPTVAGVPEVDVTHYAGSTTDVSTIPSRIGDILTDTGTTLQAELDGIQADTEDIQSRLPAALVSGRMDASVGAMQNGTITATAHAAGAIDAAALAADAGTEIRDALLTRALATYTTGGTMGDALRRLDNGANALVPFTCAASSTTTAVITTLTEATDDHYNGRTIVFLTGALAGQAATISDYTGATKTFTVAALTEAPAENDTGVVV